MSWNRRGPGPRKARGRRPDRKPLDKVRAPYNFVPLSDLVVEPDWAERVSQDVPFADGICGRLEIRITPHGPIFVRGEPGGGSRPDRFFRTPDGLVAIPGSSLRGMLRNVVEIASFGRMRRVNDHRYGVRDLHNRDLYGRYMAAIDRRHKQPVPLVSAGWLERNDGDDAEDYPALLHPCSFAKIHYKRIIAEAKSRGIHGFDPGRRQSSPHKYKAWGPNRAMQAPVRELFQQNPPGSPPRLGSFGVVQDEGRSVRGILVFTGQPSPWSPDMAPRGRRGAGNPKQHDFLFYDPPGGGLGQLKVSKRVFRDFYFVHAAAAEQHRMTDGANEELKYWLEQTEWEKGGTGRIPVFFLLEEQPAGAAHRIRAIGLAMMFRLAYRHSIRELVERQQGPDGGGLDLADLVFGHVPLDARDDGDSRHEGLKGRVSIGLGRPTVPHRDLAGVKAVLGSPKASYYPSYIEQQDGVPGGAPPRDGAGKPVYRSYMDDDARVRGWKRYQQFPGVVQPEPPRDARGKRLDASGVQSWFQPIEFNEGCGFRVPIRVHNLRPVELGALLWALDFGGAPGARHGLGMAQSLGYGSVTLEVVEGELATVRGERVDLNQARQAFEDYMEERCEGIAGGWRHSRQIFELLALATPDPAVKDLRHMQIHHPAYRNEYQLAKTQGLALAPSGDGQAWREASAGVERARAEAQAEAEARAEAAALAADPDRADREALEKARMAGGHYVLLDAWMAEAGDREEARKAVARKVIGKPSKKLRKKRPELVAWLRGR